MTEPLHPAKVKSFDYVIVPEDVKHAERALEKAFSDLLEMWQGATVTSTTMIDEVTSAINQYLRNIRPAEDAWYIPCPENFPSSIVKMVLARFRTVGWLADYLTELTDIPVIYLELKG